MISLNPKVDDLYCYKGKKINLFDQSLNWFFCLLIYLVRKTADKKNDKA